MSPLARENCTSRQSIQHPALMALAVMLDWRYYHGVELEEEQWLLAVSISPAQQFTALLKFGRGEAPPTHLHNATAQRETTQRVRLAQGRVPAPTPSEIRTCTRFSFRPTQRAATDASHGVIIEEISLEEAMKSRPSWEPEKEGTLLPGDTLRSLITESSEDFFPPCIVEEEIPPEGTTGTEEHGTSAAGTTPQGRRSHHRCQPKQHGTPRQKHPTVVVGWSSHPSPRYRTFPSSSNSGASWMIKSSAWPGWTKGWICYSRPTPRISHLDSVRRARKCTRYQQGGDRRGTSDRRTGN
jgi:hypothetical protein